MSRIRLSCPTCRTPLEIDSSDEGEEIECGSCLQVFTAGAPPRAPKGDPSDRPATGKIKGAPTRSRRREEDDPDEDDRPRRRSRRPAPPDEPDEFDYDPDPPDESTGSGFLAVASLIMGVFSLMPGCCCVFVAVPMSIGAILCGSFGRNAPGLRAAALFGIVLGHISLVFVGLRLALGWGAIGFNN